MNINLGPVPEGNFGETMDSMQAEIDGHQDLLRNTGMDVRDSGAVLIPEGPDYHGSYQVWSPLEGGDWVYIDSEGEPVIRDVCPLDD